MRPPLAAAIVSCCVALAVANPAAAQREPETPSALSAAQLLDLAERLAAGQRVAEAEALYRVALNDREDTTRAEARFRLAMLLQRTGREREAAVHLRRIVDEHPEAQRARIELAILLARLGDESAARRELRAALTLPLPAEVARGLERFEEALRQSKPTGASLSMGLAPDSNVNRATRSTTLGTVVGDFTMDPEGQPRSGLGLALSGSAFTRLPISDHVNLTGRVLGFGRLYRNTQFNDLSIGVSLGPTVRLGRSRADFALNALRRWYGEKPLADSYTASADLTRSLGGSAQVRIGASAGAVEHHRNALESGSTFGLSVGVDTAISEKSGAGFTLAASRRIARDPVHGYWSEQGSLFGWREAGRMTIASSLTAGRLVADARMPLFPEKRRDHDLRATFSVTVRRLTICGFAPAFELTFERNWSTVEIYGYRRIAGEVALRRAF